MSVSYGTDLHGSNSGLSVLRTLRAAALAWLERRLYSQIANAIKGVIGRDVDLQFVPAT
jgi:cytosine/adenosine deaminase-related metal-dependent hydrolase